MKTAWSELIQCAIDCDNSTVFHEISETVWTTCDSVDAATADARKTINAWKSPREVNEEMPITRNDIPNETPRGGWMTGAAVDKFITDNEGAIETSESPQVTRSADEDAANNERASETSGSQHLPISKDVDIPEGKTTETHGTGDKTKEKRSGNKDTARRAENDKRARNGTEGDGMVAENDRSETEGGNKDTTRRAENDKRARNGAEGDGMVAENDRSETEGRRKQESGKERRSGINKRAYTGTEILRRRESLKKLGNAVEKQWSSIEEAWDR
jgi:hypothetical protein